MESESTRKRYINDSKTLMSLTGCQDLVECLKNPKRIIKSIEEGQQKRDPTKDYALNV